MTLLDKFKAIPQETVDYIRDRDIASRMQIDGISTEIATFVGLTANKDYIRACYEQLVNRKILAADSLDLYNSFAASIHEVLVRIYQGSELSSVYYFTEEMVKTASQAAVSYPASDADLWTHQIIRMPPTGGAAYWASEIDWTVTMEGRGRFNVPAQLFFATDTMFAHVLFVTDPELPIIYPIPGGEDRVLLPSAPKKYGLSSYAVWRFLDSPIVGTTPMRFSRAERHRMKKLTPREWGPLLVTLRRAQNSAATTPEATDWSCRWIVSGHWRNQWCPSTETHRATWIAPYVKGPDDKPLHTPGAKLFVVKR